MTAHDQDRIGVLDARQRRIEIHRREIGYVVIHARLAAFHEARSAGFQKRLGREHRLAIDEIASDGRNALTGLGRCNHREGFVPAGRLQLAVAAHEHLVEPTAHQAVDLIAGLVGNPFLVDVVIDAGKRAHDFAPAAVEPDVRADRIADVDRERLLQLPRTGLERIGTRCQCADRAQVDHIGRKLVFRGLFEIGRDLHVLAAPDRADLVHARDFLAEAHAAGAVDAAGHDRLDQRPHIFLGHRALVLVIARGAATIGHRLILKVAFAALVADRAVERMVDEQELHHTFARGLDHLRVGADFLAFGGRKRATRLRLRRSGLHFDQTHAAIARDAQPFVIAEARDFLTRKLAGLEHGGAVRNLDFLAVYGDFRHLLILLVRHSAASTPRNRLLRPIDCEASVRSV